jgi:transcriptional regulator with XRE-family HTH domain
MATLTNDQKYEWAKMIFLKENLTQKEIAEKVGVTAKTLGKWIAQDNWAQYKSSIIITKEQELRRIYMQINELNTYIFSREEGSRFANSKEADTLTKLTAAARSLETDTSVADVIEVAMQVCNFIKKDDLQKAQEVSNYFEAFIKTKL